MLNNYFFHMLSLQKLIVDLVLYVFSKHSKFGVNPSTSYDFVWNYMQQYRIVSKKQIPPPPQIAPFFKIFPDPPPP